MIAVIQKGLKNAILLPIVLFWLYEVYVCCIQRINSAGDLLDDFFLNVKLLVHDKYTYFSYFMKKTFLTTN